MTDTAKIRVISKGVEGTNQLGCCKGKGGVYSARGGRAYVCMIFQPKVEKNSVQHFL